MTPILLAIALLGQRPIPWPPETGNNGYDLYVQAAKLVSTPEWASINRDRPRTPFTQSLSIAYLQREAQASTGILELLKEGNSIPAFDPFKQETAATLHPEFMYFKSLAKISSDLADLNARTGHPDAASEWLLAGETFAYRLPASGMIAALVKAAMLQRLQSTALRVLPSLTAEQIGQHVELAREIAEHPVDMVHVAEEELEMFDASVKETVANPAILGLKDEPIVDPVAFMGQLVRLKNLNDKEGRLAMNLMARLPSGPDVTPDAVKADIAKFGKTVPTSDQAAYKKVLPMIEAAYMPQKVSSYQVAKHLDSKGREHVEALVRALCDRSFKDQEAAYSRPEREWGRPWKSIDDDNSASAMVMKDGSHLEWLQEDFYGMYIAQVLGMLVNGGSGDEEIYMCKPMLLIREKARLFVVHVELAEYVARHGELPLSLTALGNPADPLSNRPYAYERTGPKTYTLAAVGVPGFKTIDMKTVAGSDAAK